MQCPLHSVKFETNFTICSKTLQFLQTHLLVLDISIFCICTVHTWVNGTCWAASTDLVILIHGIVVPITSCICWSDPGSVVHSLLLFTFDFIQRLNSNFLQISGFCYISGNPVHEKSWAKILDTTQLQTENYTSFSVDHYLSGLTCSNRRFKARWVTIFIRHSYN